MKIVLTGGGTGGHIYPALSIAKEIQRRHPQAELLYIGTDKGLEKEIVAQTDIPFEAIEISGFKRSLSLENMKTVWRFLRGSSRSKKLLQAFQPDAVIGTGGYVCGPVIYAAAKLQVPTIIHEQNAVPGLTNAFLSRYTDCVAVSFKGTEKQFAKAKKVVYTGNPCATEVVQADPARGRASLHIQDQSDIVLMVGGSRGALALNQAMIELVPHLPQLPDTHFVFVTGKPYYDRTKEEIDKLCCQMEHPPERLQVLPYIDNMPQVLAATSLIINRAGASFLAEITALGIPSILVPSPNVTNNHQEANARWLSEQQASILFLERELSGDKLFTSIKETLTDPIRKEYMSKQAKRNGQPDAASLLYQELRQLAGYSE